MKTEFTTIDPGQLPKHFENEAGEKRIHRFWEDKGINFYDASKSREETFVVDTPPPTVSGSLHVGHIFSYAHTDFIARYKRMTGKNIFYPMGWDDNGLPTERRVQNYFHVRCEPTLPYEEGLEFQMANAKIRKKRPRLISRKNFIELCNQLTQEDEKAFKELWQRLGLSVDWRQEYNTINTRSRTIAQLSFLDLFEKGHIYPSSAPIMWDVDFQTSIAQAEVEDRMVAGQYHHIAFGIKDSDHTFEIATTRPELLPACVGVTCHPDDERFNHLIGSKAVTPLFGVEVPIFASEEVDPEKGTGMVMVCTFGDATDVEWWERNQLLLRNIVGLNGRLVSVTFGEENWESVHADEANGYYSRLEGQKVVVARKTIADLLRTEVPSWQKAPALVRQEEPVERMVKFYEKGDRPLELIPTRQWFVRLMDKKEALLDKGNAIDWYPGSAHGRFNSWTENLAYDWNISRQRFFGVPMPVWYPLDETGNPDRDRPILPTKDQLPIDPMIDIPNGYEEDQRGVPNGFRGESDVLDTWFTSSMSPQIAAGWETEPGKFSNLFPFDIRPQSHEIIRTWAFYTIAKAMLHEGDIPWRNVLISGWVLDPDRKKMSKSKGNVETPDQWLDTYSADGVRYWSAKAKLGVDTTFDPSVMKIGQRLVTKIYNAAKFTYAQKGTRTTISHELDLSFIQALKQLIAEVTACFQRFDHAKALSLTETFFWENYTDSYIELVKKRAFDACSDVSGEGGSAIQALRVGLSIINRLFAPFLPYITEEVWSWVEAEESGYPSIHKAPWPVTEELDAYAAPQTPDAFAVVVDCLKHIHKLKSSHNYSVGKAMTRLEIRAEAAHIDILQRCITDLQNAARTEKITLEVHTGTKEAPFEIFGTFADTPALP